MELPEKLTEALEACANGEQTKRLLAAAEEISLRYRTRQGAGGYVRTREEALAFTPPDFLYRDVTETPGFSMSRYWETRERPKI